jgi:hypothetical protein
MLVEAISGQWGWCPLADGTAGKVVWAAWSASGVSAAWTSGAGELVLAVRARSSVWPFPTVMSRGAQVGDELADGLVGGLGVWPKFAHLAKDRDHAPVSAVAGE